jgi:hypothetical protein
MHTLEMKNKGFIKKKVTKAFITWSVEKATFIPLTHVYQPTLENDGAWGIRSQHLSNVTYGEIPIHRNILLHMWMGIVREHV